VIPESECYSESQLYLYGKANVIFGGTSPDLHVRVTVWVSMVRVSRVRVRLKG